MRKADKLFELIHLVRVHQPITAATLATKLNVSIRSVYRYITDLSATIPIYGEVGVGYRLSEGFELPPLHLTQDEMDALLLGIELLSITTGARLPRAANSLLHKIQAALPNLDQNNTTTLPPAQALSLAYRGYSKALWDTLWNAIQQKIVLKIEYVSLKNQTSQRVIYPLGLFYWGKVWTLAAWCTLRCEFRSFRIDKIAHIIETQERFTLTEQLHLQAYIDYQKSRCQYTSSLLT